MNFEIEKKEFLRGLGLMQSVAGRKTTLPILSHILLEWDKNVLFLTGTDLETGIREELISTVHQKGKASVSAKKLYEIVRELPDESIHIQKKENQWITLQCGKSIFNLAGLDPEEFPSLPTHQEEHFSKVSTRLIREMIEKTVFAASNEESRYHLNGVLLSQAKQPGKEILRMVATDGHRLCLIDWENQKIRGVEEKGMIIPKKGVLEIRKIIGERGEEEEMGIYFNATHGFFKMEKSLTVIRLIDGEFPEYEQVIPKGNDKQVVMVKERMTSSLKRVSTMASERIEGIKLALKKNCMEMFSTHQDYGDAKEEVEVAYEGPPLQVGFNARYLIEALNAIDAEEVFMELKDEGSPGMLRPAQAAPGISGQFCIIMPMRL
jgi:DNA polymerase-3 subunit beta